MSYEWWSGNERITMPRWCWAIVLAALLAGIAWGLGGVFELSRALSKI